MKLHFYNSKKNVIFAKTQYTIKAMDKKTILFGVCVALCSTTMAQQKQGGITAKMLQSFSKTHNTSAQNKALYNAITSNSIDDLARNHANAGAIDTYFSVETIKQKIHNQKSSGRCWMFTGLNVFRGNFAKAHKDTINVEYSQAYLFFYDQLEKANIMLEGAINTANKPLDHKDVQFFFKNPINDGGTFCGVADLVDKYGLVPKEVFPETYSAENTSRMASIISSQLRQFGLELRDMVNGGKKKADIAKRKTQMLGTVYGILSLTLGEPIKQFNYAFKDKQGKTVTPEKSYTPLSFYQETVGKPQNGSFIMAMNDPSRPYYKVYEIELDRHTQDGQNWKYINLPMEDIYTMAINSLKDGTKLYTSYDVGKQLDKKRGYLDVNNYDYGSLFNISFSMNKAQRIPTFDSGSTHAMTLTAVDLDEKGQPKKWKVENSWGAEYGHDGYLIMSKKWFDEYFFRIVVDKKYVPENILKLDKQKSIMLPYDDPMFSAEQ